MRPGFDFWVEKIPWKSERQPNPVLLPADFHGQRSLVDCSPWGLKESDPAEHARTAQQTYLKDISSFCVTTYTFTVIWRPGGSWGCSVSWARRWWVGKTGPILHLSLPTFCSILPYKVLTWGWTHCLGNTATFHQHPLTNICPWAWVHVGVHTSDAVP